MKIICHQLNLKCKEKEDKDGSGLGKPGRGVKGQI